MREVAVRVPKRAGWEPSGVIRGDVLAIASLAKSRALHYRGRLAIVGVLVGKNPT
ncbi:hypothetical protein WN48_05878 [Eufriesea mexicana]|uniref:Uncharacterized protein n=1 Tax=Eufriesea mexicana TaxID=516756 RepID=A0A310SKM2_9HYME|nr:hypothetical protein WN48_05878 [Eufriesea mexicana]